MFRVILHEHAMWLTMQVRLKLISIVYNDKNLYYNNKLVYKLLYL